MRRYDTYIRVCTYLIEGRCVLFARPSAEVVSDGHRRSSPLQFRLGHLLSVTAQNTPNTPKPCFIPDDFVLYLNACFIPLMLRVRSDRTAECPPTRRKPGVFSTELLSPLSGVMKACLRMLPGCFWKTSLSWGVPRLARKLTGLCLSSIFSTLRGR